MPTVSTRASEERCPSERDRDDEKCARTYRQRPRLGLVIRRLHLADDVPARVLRGGPVEGVRGELQVFRLLSERERVESAVARKRTVEPRRAVTERERDLRRIARVFSSVDPKEQMVLLNLLGGKLPIGWRLCGGKSNQVCEKVLAKADRTFRRIKRVAETLEKVIQSD